MKKFFLGIGPLLFLLILILPLSLSAEEKNLLAIMSLVVPWWLGAVIPLPVTGIIGVCLATLLGVSSFSQALRGFGNPVVFLFMGGFLLAEAMRVHKLDLWIAHTSLNSKMIQGSSKRILLMICVLAAIFSSFLSNTATTAMFIPIAFSIFSELNVDEDHPSFSLLLMVAYAATIGGVMTPLGSPPNAIALSFLDKMMGIKIGFLDWVIKMFPLALITLGGLFIVFRKELALLPNCPLETTPSPPINRNQKKLIAVLLGAVFLWVMPGVFQLVLGVEHPISLLLSKNLPEGVVALLMSSLLFLIPDDKQKSLLAWKDAQRIDWGTLLLFGSGISLGLMMFETGLAERIGRSLPFESLGLFPSLCLISGITLFATELVSNTATANLLIPLALTTSPFKEHPIPGALMIALSANMAFMLPVGTPPNAIVYGTGKVKLEWMIRKGFLMNLICLLGIWGWGLIFT
jgi:solute carrier family 13 (sodium-dependent dicarboxylate transporter), member 2/3/5